MKKAIVIFAGLIVILSGCGGGEQSVSYEETKQMFIDLLKTNEGKEAVQELFSDEDIKKELVLDQQVVKEAIDTTLLSKDGKKFWEDTFKDPAFAEVLAKSMKDEHEKLIKGLMKDPEYQEMMLQLLQDPTMQEQTLDLMNSQAYREETKKQMMEVMESPLVQKEMQDLLVEAAKKLAESDDDKQEDSGDEEGGGDEEESSDGSGEGNGNE
ncbi:spore germination lipoprotein GerD [Jeotgalibacillus marinus]|uniref:Spore germination lipoprotein GerD n=1 Tax=Jeotgalibacillus marinus TaxID=86667 RepID=A0ABV3Q6K3_9BACL